MNYVELKQNIKDICENEFSDDALAMFVQQAEQKIYNSVQLASLRRNVAGVLTPNNAYLSAPEDFMSVYSIAVVKPSGEYVYLLNKDVSFIREAYPVKNATGVPKHYAIFGPNSAFPTQLSLLLGPTPDAAYATEMHYFYYPESIVTAGTTWLGDNFDSALLNGCLIEAIRYMKGEQADVANYEKLYLQAITLLKQLGDGKQRTDTYRGGQYRMPVS